MESQINFGTIGQHPLKNVYFDRDKRTFVLCAGENGEHCCQVDYGYSDFDGSVTDGIVVLYTNASHMEGDVRKVKVTGNGDITVGWLCTVGALTSRQHDYFESQYFRKAAYVAVHRMIQDGLFTKQPELNEHDTVKLSDFFDEDLTVLVLHRPSISVDVGTDCANVLPCLHQYGFVPIWFPLLTTVEVGQVASDAFVNAGKTIQLTPTSIHVAFNDFTDQMFRQLLPVSGTPLLRFFLYYQLIETLLARIFSHRQSQTIQQMQPVRENPAKIHPLIEKLKDDAVERKRMNLLFNEYSGVMARSEDLKIACNRFLTEYGSGEKPIVSEALYEVRNIIFHDLRSVSDRATTSLGEIVGQMGWVVPELLMSFRLPE